MNDTYRFIKSSLKLNLAKILKSMGLIVAEKKTAKIALIEMKY